MSTLFETILLRRDTAANWVKANPILDSGEPGYETDTTRLKIGNGITAWNLLPYFGSIYASSYSTHTVGTGSKTFLVSTGLAFIPNMIVTVSYVTDPLIYMTAIVTSYNSSTGSLVLNITSVVGSGTNLTPWVIWLSAGSQGPQGEQGIQGIQGDPGAGFPSGGTTGQVLTKVSAADYDTEWATPDIPIGVPVGGIIPFAHPTVPNGYLECDGASYLRTSYADLFSAIGTIYGSVDGTHFNVPDYRGYFLRGWAHGSAVDPDKATRTNRGDTVTGDYVGTIQADAFKAHVHSMYTLVGHGYQGGAIPYDGGSGRNTSSTGGSETRPINKNVMFCIKY